MQRSGRNPIRRRAMFWLLALVACSLPGGCQKNVQPGAPAPVALYCYVGGTMQPAMKELARLYEQRTGVKIEMDYGDSGANVIKVETTGRGDLYVGHDPFHGAMVHKDLTREGWVVAGLQPVIAVPKGNPKNIRVLKDLARSDVKVILTDKTYSTLGHVCDVIFGKAHLTEEIEKRVVTRMRMGGQAANAVVMETADAAIVWNAVAFLRRDKLDSVPIEQSYRPVPGVDAVTSATFGPIDMGAIRVTVDVLKCSAQAEAASKFAAFLASSDAEKVWLEQGFDSPPPGRRRLAPAGEGSGSAASSGPLLLYAGAGLRPAVTEVAEAFTKATGVAVECDWAGSGMLISRMRLARQGDLFMPGDVYYIELADKEGLVESQTKVCYLLPVILVQKGNPKGIAGLADLAKPGIRLGMGKAEACQIGRTSDQLFAKNKIDRQAVEKNVQFYSVTVNELGVQLQTGHLDAAIVWDAVAAYYSKDTDVVKIPLERNEASSVAVAVLKSSKQPALARRFADFLRGRECQAILHKHQYLTEPPR